MNTIVQDGVASQDRLAELVEELTARLKSGETVDLEAFVADYPGQADELRRLYPALRLLADSSRAGEASFGSGVTGSEEAELGELGDFRLVREIGKGGMGVVYEAEQVSLRRRVALKVLPFAGMLDQRQLLRFQNEARAAACLHHAHIVPVYFVGCERGVHFYAMQLVQGSNLADLIRDLRHQDGHETNPSPQPPPRNGEGEKACLLPLSASGRGVGGRGERGGQRDHGLRHADDSSEAGGGDGTGRVAVDGRAVAAA
jgi:hypothetical protein